MVVDCDENEKSYCSEKSDTVCYTICNAGKLKKLRHRNTRSDTVSKYYYAGGYGCSNFSYFKVYVSETV